MHVTYNIYVILMSHEDKNDWIMDRQDMTQLNGTGTLRACIQSRWILVKLGLCPTILVCQDTSGIILEKATSTDLRKYTEPESQKRMMHNFSNMLATFWTEKEYEENFDTGHSGLPTKE